MKVGFITMEKFENRQLNSVGSSRIRARWVYKYWKEAEEWKTGHKYDAVVFQKVYWRDYMKKFKGIKIFDICDPDWLDNRPVMEAIGLCDAVATSSPNLRDYIKKYILFVYLMKMIY